MPALPPVEVAAGHRPPDLRAVVLGVSAWAGGLAVVGLPGWTVAVLVVLGAVLVGTRRRGGRAARTLLACLLAASAVGCVTTLRVRCSTSR